MDFSNAPMSRRSMLAMLSTLAVTSVVSRACAQAPALQASPASPAGAWQTNTVRSQTDGLDIVYHIAGDGPPLVIVHGGASTAQPYTALGDMLTPRFRVARVERRNYTVSGNRPAPNSWEQEVGDVAAVIDRLGGRSHLFGHSAGALVSLHVARRRPELIHKLALYEPPLLGGGQPVVAIKAHFEELMAADRRDDAIVLLYSFFVGLPEAAVRARLSQGASAVYPLLPGARADLEALITLDGDPQHYRAIALDTLLLVGEQSAEHPLRDSSAALAQILPHARTVPLPGQGHSAQVSAPQLIAEALLPFFGQA